MEWTVATIARKVNRETRMTTTTTQNQTQQTRAPRNPHRNQNRRLGNEKRNSIRASQNVSVPPPLRPVLLLDLALNRGALRRWTSYRGRIRKRDGGRTKSTGCCRLVVVAMGSTSLSVAVMDPRLHHVRRARALSIAFDITLRRCRLGLCVLARRFKVVQAWPI